MATIMHMNPAEEATLTGQQIETRQAAAWAETFRYACERSPFYQRHFQQAGLSSAATPRIDRIPPIDKRILSENADAFLCVPRHRIIDVVSTSGTTGRPLIWYLTESDLQRLAWNEYHSFRCAGLSETDTVLLAVTLDRCFIAGMAYFLGLRQLGCAVVRIGPATPTMHLDLLSRVEATAIVGVPSFLNLLAGKAREAGVDLGRMAVRKLICIGETIRNPDGTLNRIGSSVSTQWQARAFSTYGVTELAASLCECESGAGGHLHPGLLYLEALDDAGNPLPDGQVGELTATTFGVEAMPLIRYRTGDCAAIDRTPCSCGRQTLRIGPVQGRKGQRLKFKGTSLFPSTLQRVLDSVAEVDSYVIIARRDSVLSDWVEVRLACQGGFEPLVRQLRERFQGDAKVLPEITQATPQEIEKLQWPEGARKRRWFVDLRSSPGTP